MNSWSTRIDSVTNDTKKKFDTKSHDDNDDDAVEKWICTPTWSSHIFMSRVRQTTTFPHKTHTLPVLEGLKSNKNNQRAVGELVKRERGRERENVSDS